VQKVSFEDCFFLNKDFNNTADIKPADETVIAKHEFSRNLLLATTKYDLIRMKIYNT